jgi:hypothetical protein
MTTIFFECKFCLITVIFKVNLLQLLNGFITASKIKEELICRNVEDILSFNVWILKNNRIISKLPHSATGNYISNSFPMNTNKK